MTADGTVRAAVLREVGAPFEVEEITLEPVGPRDVRVRMAASGVCHSDLSVQNGTIPFIFPTVLGHEGAGVVAEIGSDVTRVKEGDHVVLTWMPPCRNCFWCLAGQPMLCNTGMGESLGGPYASVGGTKLIRGLGTATFAEQTLVPEFQVVPVDRAAPLELAALVGCALSTGIGAVWHTAAIEPGSTVAVIGCGGVGLSVIQGARLAGASIIVGVDHMGAKLAAARSVGATDTVNSSSGDAVAAVQALTGGWASTTPSRWWVGPPPSAWPSKPRDAAGRPCWWGRGHRRSRSPSAPSSSSWGPRPWSDASTAPPTPTATSPRWSIW